MRRFLAILLIVLAGCATTAQTPAQILYGLHGSYAAALVIANQYTSLMLCDAPGAPVLCAQPKLVEEIRVYDQRTYDRMTQARALLTQDPGHPLLPPALTDAQVAVRDFTNIVNKLPKVK